MLVASGKDPGPVPNVRIRIRNTGLNISKYSLSRNNTIFYDVSHTINPRFLTGKLLRNSNFCGTLTLCTLKIPLKLSGYTGRNYEIHFEKYVFTLWLYIVL
jgi:hypothetical protein